MVIHERLGAPPPLPLPPMNWMSSCSSVRNNAALFGTPASAVSRAPISALRGDHWLECQVGREGVRGEHGAARSAQVDSAGLGTRVPAWQASYNVTSDVGLVVSPTAGLKRQNVWRPFSALASSSARSTWARPRRVAIEEAAGIQARRVDGMEARAVGAACSDVRRTIGLSDVVSRKSPTSWVDVFGDQVPTCSGIRSQLRAGPWRRSRQASARWPAPGPTASLLRTARSCRQ